MVAMADKRRTTITSWAPVIGSVVLMLAVACSLSQSEDRLEIPNDALIRDMVWLADGWIYLVAEGGSGEPDELWRVRRDFEAERVDINADPVCTEIVRIWSVFVIDDNLGVGGGCDGGGETQVLAFTAPGVASVITTFPLPTDSIAVAADALYADNLVGECRGLMVSKNGNIGWLSVDGANRPEAHLQPRLDGDRPCVDPVDVGHPATSARGEHLALLLSSGGSTRRRVMETASLYYGQDASQMRRLADDIDRPIDIAMSANGSLVAVSARHHADGGIWLADAESGDYSLVATGAFGSVTFSPDSTELAAVRADGSEVGHELVILDVVQ